MANVFDYLPRLEGEELHFIQHLMTNMTETQARRFASVYDARRQDPTLILGLTCAGFAGFAGIHRFLLGHIGMGILYFLTGGLCMIGTIVDLVNSKKLTFDHNRRVAEEVYPFIKTME